MTSVQPCPVRADAARVGSIAAAQALRFRGLLSAAGFLPSPPDEIADVVEGRARGGRNLPRLLDATAAGRPIDVFARLFLLDVPVRVSAARAAMDAPALEEWIDAGLVALDGDSLRALTAFCPFDGLLLAYDKPGLLESNPQADHVSGPTNSTANLASFMVKRPFAKILDLGTGCGVLGFLAARNGGRLLASDVNPRAVEFARFNARMNSIGNVEFACGSGFEPARGRRFDLILANLPCVLGPAARLLFRDSGMDLDGFGRAVVAEAQELLEEGGLFQCTAEWPGFADADWKQRAAAWLSGVPCDALALRVRETEALRHAEETVCDTDVLDSEEQARLYAAYADYFRRRCVTSISEGLLALRRRSAGPYRAWYEERLGRCAPTYGDGVERYFAAADAIAEAADGLFERRLRMAPSLSFGVWENWDGDAWGRKEYAIRQADGFAFQARVDATIANLLRRCDGSATLREVAAATAEEAGVPFEAVAQGCLTVVRDMLRRGFLVIPPSGASPLSPRER